MRQCVNTLNTLLLELNPVQFLISIEHTGLLLACVRHNCLFDDLNLRILINFFLPFVTGFVLLLRLLHCKSFYIFNSRRTSCVSLTPDVLMSRFVPVACNHIAAQTLIKIHLTPTVFICAWICCCRFLFVSDPTLGSSSRFFQKSRGRWYVKNNSLILISMVLLKSSNLTCVHTVALSRLSSVRTSSELWVALGALAVFDM